MRITFHVNSTAAVSELEGGRYKPADAPTGEGPGEGPGNGAAEPHDETIQMRRLARLTNGFSKKWENLKAMLALYFGWYNFCRVHRTLRVTPAMQAGITDHVWEIGELLHAR